MASLYYSDYLHLNRLLDSQHLESVKQDRPAHDEMVFIITHQTYELWFKQIIFELESVIDIFDDPLVHETRMATVLHRLNRIKTIQWVLIQQIDVIKTITPMDFLEFRDLLVPASGFQSIQFKQIEIMLGIKRKFRIAADQEFFCTRLTKSDKADLDKLEEKPSVLELTDNWLRRMPFLEFGDFNFWQAYADAVEKMLTSDEQIIRANETLTDREKHFQLNDLLATRTRFQSVFDESKFNDLRDQGEFRLSHQGFLAALFVHLYRDEPMIYTPFRYLSLLLDIDELFTNWRQKHAVMVQRMLGTKIGTGGSSGHDYLDATTQKNRVFTDLYNLSTFLIPREDLPELPVELRRALGYFFSGQKN